MTAWLAAVLAAAHPISLAVLAPVTSQRLAELALARRNMRLASLGPRWTTRIAVVPGAPLVRSGPHRFVRCRPRTRHGARRQGLAS